MSESDDNPSTSDEEVVRQDVTVASQDRPYRLECATLHPVHPHGLQWRLSPDLADRDPEPGHSLFWGSLVVGTVADGWLRHPHPSGPRFLPVEFKGHQVLHAVPAASAASGGSTPVVASEASRPGTATSRDPQSPQSRDPPSRPTSARPEALAEAQAKLAAAERKLQQAELREAQALEAQAQAREAQAKLAETERRLLEAEAVAAQLTTRLEPSSGAPDELQAQLQRAQADAQAAQARSAALAEDSQTARLAEREAVQDAQRRAAEVAGLEAQQADLERRAQEAAAAAAEVERAARAAIEQKQAQVAQLEAEKQDLYQRLAAGPGAAPAPAAAMEPVAAPVASDLEARLATLEAERDGLAQRVEAQSEAAASGEAARLRQQVAELEQAQAKTAEQQLREALDQQHQEHAQETSRDRVLLLEAQDVLEGLSRDYEVATALLAEQAEQHRVLDAEHRQQLDAASERVARLEPGASELRVAQCSSELGEQALQLQRELQQAQALVEQERRQRGQLEQRQQALAPELLAAQQAQQQLAQERASCHTLEAALAEAQAQAGQRLIEVEAGAEAGALAARAFAAAEDARITAEQHIAEQSQVLQTMGAELRERDAAAASHAAETQARAAELLQAQELLQRKQEEVERLAEQREQLEQRRVEAERERDEALVRAQAWIDLRDQVVQRTCDKVEGYTGAQQDDLRMLRNQVRELTSTVERLKTSAAAELTMAMLNREAELEERFTERLATMERDIIDQQNQVLASERHRKWFEAELARKRLELNEKERELIRVQEEKDRVREEVSEELTEQFNRQMRDLADEVQQLSDENGVLQQRMQKAEAQAEEMKKQTRMIRRDMERKVSEQRAIYVEECKSLSQKLRRCQEDNAFAVQRQQEAAEQMAQKMAKLEEENKRVTANNVRLQQVDRKLRRTEVSMQEFQGKCDQLEQELAEAYEQREKVEDELRDTHERAEQQRTAMGKLMADCDRLGHTQLVQEHEAEVARGEARVAQAGLASVNRRLVSLKAEAKEVHAMEQELARIVEQLVLALTMTTRGGGAEFQALATQALQGRLPGLVAELVSEQILRLVAHHFNDEPALGTGQGTSATMRLLSKPMLPPQPEQELFETPEGPRASTTPPLLAIPRTAFKGVPDMKMAKVLLTNTDTLLAGRGAKMMSTELVDKLGLACARIGGFGGPSKPKKGAPRRGRPQSRPVSSAA